MICGLRRIETHVKLNNFERLQAESRFNFLFDDFGWGLLGGEWVFGARVGLRFDDFEGAVDTEVEGEIGLRVVRESQLLGHVRCVICCNRPFLNLNLFAAIHTI